MWWMVTCQSLCAPSRVSGTFSQLVNEPRISMDAGGCVCPSGNFQRKIFAYAGAGACNLFFEAGARNSGSQVIGSPCCDGFFPNKLLNIAVLKFQSSRVQFSEANQKEKIWVVAV